MIRAVTLILALVSPAIGQSTAVRQYVGDVDLARADKSEIEWLMPLQNQAAFARYIVSRSSGNASAAADWGAFLRTIEGLRLNKLIGAVSGETGTTSLVSSVAAPAVVGLAIERGGIRQVADGTVMTLRGNALGLAKLALGAEQFPYYAEIDDRTPAYRHFRRLSGFVSFEHINKENVQPLTTAEIFGSDSQMAAWGVRFDLTGSTNLDDPEYMRNWDSQVETLRESSKVNDLLNAINNLMGNGAFLSKYTCWVSDTTQNLLILTTGEARLSALEVRLDELADAMEVLNPDLQADAEALIHANNAYLEARDAAIRNAQTHKLSVEYANRHPRKEPNRSTVRVIYSHQPGDSNQLVTLGRMLFFATSS